MEIRHGMLRSMEWNQWMNGEDASQHRCMNERVATPYSYLNCCCMCRHGCRVYEIHRHWVRGEEKFMVNSRILPSRDK